MDKCSFYRHSFQNAWKNMKKGEKIILTLLKPSLNPKKRRFFRFSKKVMFFLIFSMPIGVKKKCEVKSCRA